MQECNDLIIHRGVQWRIKVEVDVSDVTEQSTGYEINMILRDKDDVNVFTLVEGGGATTSVGSGVVSTFFVLEPVQTSGLSDDEYSAGFVLVKDGVPIDFLAHVSVLIHRGV